MSKRKIRPRFEDTTCGYNAESGNWKLLYKMLGLLLALSYEQGFISISFKLDLTIPLCTIPLCIMLLIFLFKGTKERPAVDLQGIFSSISTNKLTNTIYLAR
jgi:hypothetical protein